MRPIIRRWLALLLAVAVLTPLLLADDGDDRQSVDPIVGCWIVHVTVHAVTLTRSSMCAGVWPFL